MKRPYHILYFDDFGYPGGAEIATLRLIQSLDKNKFIPYFILPFEGYLSRQLEKRGAKTFYVDLLSLKKDIYKIFPPIKAISRIREIIEKEEIDLLHPISLWTSYFALLANLGLNLSMVLSLHSFPKVKSRLKAIFFSITRGQVFQRIKKIIVVSKALKEALVRLGLEEERLVVIPNCLDPELLKKKETNFFRIKYNLPPNSLIIGMIGRLHPGKGQMTFLKSMPLVLEKCPEAHFIIAGEEYRTPLENLGFKEELKSMAKKLGIDSRIVFIDFYENLGDLLYSMNILAHSSPEETFGLAILDAMTAGLPCVATNTGGIPELVEDGITGFLVPPNDPLELAEKIVFLCKNSHLRASMGNAARQKALTYSTELVSNLTENLYLKLLER